jgi:hypothetical protein
MNEKCLLTLAIIVIQKTKNLFMLLPGRPMFDSNPRLRGLFLGQAEIEAADGLCKPPQADQNQFFDPLLGKIGFAALTILQ